MPDIDPIIGTTLDGRFVLAERIGLGGMGAVYRARQLQVDRDVAVKVLRADGDQPAPDQLRFENEAKIVSRLRHPNTLRLYDFGRTADGRLYLVTELLEGEPLSAVLSRGPLDERRTLRILKQVAESLGEAHALGIIHRDLKPENIFLERVGGQEMVKVLDFGIAKVAAERIATETGSAIGTPGYMSPEQAQGRVVDARSDLYSLGAIAYECLTGERPFAADSAVSLLLKHVTDAPVPPSQLSPHVRVSAATEELVLDLLAKSPDLRPKSALALRDAIEAIEHRPAVPAPIVAPTIAPTDLRPAMRTSSIESFIAELKRRRIFRAMVGYGLVSFTMLQVIEPIQHGLHLPDSMITYVVVALALGFPLVMVAAWAADAAASKREIMPSGPGAPARLRGVRLGAMLVGLGALAAVPGLGWYFLLRTSPTAALAEQARTGPGEAAPAPSEAIPSIAVLPFTDMSARHDQEYFSDGIAEEILNALAQLDGMQIAGRTSSFSFKGGKEDLREIGRKLSVANVLEGSVRTSGSRVRITAQLVKVVDGFHLWSQTFDRDVTDIFAVQDEIARAIVAVLKVKLLAGQGGVAKERRTASPEAYTEYLRGRQSQRLGTLDGHREAIAAYRRAIERDSGFAPPRAWLGLAEAGYWSLAGVPPAAAFQEYEREARPESDRAIALAPDLADGYLSRGWLRLTFAWEWHGAKADLDRAREISPGDPDVLLRSSLLLASQGRLQDAIALARTVLERDPLSTLGAFFLGSFFNSAGEYGRARSVLEAALAAAPGAGFASRELAFTELYDGRPAEALKRFEQLRQPAARKYGTAMALYSLGRTQEAEKLLDELMGAEGRDSVYHVAQVLAWKGDADRAFEWLERARVQHDTGIRSVKYDRMLQSLHSDARWAALLHQVSLPVD